MLVLLVCCMMIYVMSDIWSSGSLQTTIEFVPVEGCGTVGLYPV